MMKHPVELWTSQDLEIFHDDQLDADRASRLSDALCGDPSLRKRLDAVRRVDDALRNAMLQPRAAHPLSRRTDLHRWLAAASVLLVVGVAGWCAWERVVHDRHAPQRFVDAPAYPVVRILFSLPVSGARSSKNGNDPIERRSASDEDAGIFLARLGRALAGGDVEGTLDLLSDAPVDRRRMGYRYLGDILRSAQVAESILDRLGPDEQLAVCRHWAGDSAIRSAVFSRLQRLSDEPSMTEQVHEVLAQLSTDPALRPWLRGYQLWQGS